MGGNRAQLYLTYGLSNEHKLLKFRGAIDLTTAKKC